MNKRNHDPKTILDICSQNYMDTNSITNNWWDEYFHLNILYKRFSPTLYSYLWSELIIGFIYNFCDTLSLSIPKNVFISKDRKCFRRISRKTQKLRYGFYSIFQSIYTQSMDRHRTYMYEHLFLDITRYKGT